MRGKHGNKAARRDAEVLQARLDELQQRFDQYRTTAEEELRVVRESKQRLHNQLLNDVEELAAEQVRQAQQRHAEQIEALRQEHYATNVAVVDTLWRDTSMSSETLHKILELTNVKMGDVPLAARQPGTDRGLRRAGSREAAKVSRHNHLTHRNGGLEGKNGPMIGHASLLLTALDQPDAEAPADDVDDEHPSVTARYE